MHKILLVYICGFFFIYDLIAKKIFNDIIKKTYKYFIFAFTSSLEMIFKGTWTYHSSWFYWTEWGFTVCEYIGYLNDQGHWDMSPPVMFPLLGMGLNMFLLVMFRSSKSLLKCVFNVIFSSLCSILLLSNRRNDFHCLRHGKLL